MDRSLEELILVWLSSQAEYYEQEFARWLCVPEGRLRGKILHAVRQHGTSGVPGRYRYKCKVHALQRLQHFLIEFQELGTLRRVTNVFLLGPRQSVARVLERRKCYRSQVPLRRRRRRPRWRNMSYVST
ncbi:MAG: hypothetical protein ACOYBJ_02625 [Patescibacteria group bacterium]